MEPVSPARPHLPHFERENLWSHCRRSNPAASQVSPIRMKCEGSNQLKEIHINRAEVPPWNDARARGERTLGSTLLEVLPWPRIFQKGGRVRISP